MQSLTEKFIFISRGGDEVSRVFSNKILLFHECFSDCIILSGTGEAGDCANSLEMTKSPAFKEDYFKEVVEGLQSVEPLFISTLIKDEKIDAYLSMFYLPFESVEGFFLLQQIDGWGGSSKTSYQVWKMLDGINLYSMTDHWRE